ncbi:hypothetical protein NE237_014288 [Protea cynaroides]|uniref:Uncharacterized protein n=1 Tax=Protea cynaroides TaxID=273540 RepID=A0A9Q0GL60_9MAGN|nr:hypothetical protein NE237_014288 [Protea cynaroides]
MKKRITLTPPATSLSNQHENSLFWHSFPLLCVNSLPSAPLALRGVAVTFSTARMRGPRNVVLVSIYNKKVESDRRKANKLGTPKWEEGCCLWMIYTAVRTASAHPCSTCTR